MDNRRIAAHRVVGKLPEVAAGRRWTGWTVETPRAKCAFIHYSRVELAIANSIWEGTSPISTRVDLADSESSYPNPIDEDASVSVVRFMRHRHSSSATQARGAHHLRPEKT